MNGPLFVLRRRPNRVSQERWGFAVGKRLAPKAVERNRARRRLREAARSVMGSAEERGEGSGAHFDYVVTAKGGMLTASFERLSTELARLMERARGHAES